MAVETPEKIVADSKPLSKELLRKMDAYWRAANYLSVGQIYLFDNPLLREPLKPEHVKPRAQREVIHIAVFGDRHAAD